MAVSLTLSLFACLGACPPGEAPRISVAVGDNRPLATFSLLADAGHGLSHDAARLALWFDPSHSQPTQPLDLCRRLDEISQKAQPTEQEYNEAKQILDSIAREPGPADPTVMASLSAIALDEKRSALISFPVMLVLCEKAEQAWADKLVAAMLERATILANVPFGRRDIVHGRMAGILNTFVEDCAKQLLPKLSSARPMFDLPLAYSLLDLGWLKLPAMQKAWWLIATADVDVAIRKEFALKIIKARRRDYPYPDRFERLFGKEDIPILRKLVRTPNNTPRTFCIGAADILAHLGDEESIPDIRAFILAHPICPAPPEEQVKAYVFRIELQHPPTRLLGFIRGGSWGDGLSREWAVERALDYKIDKASIREAILEHAKKHADDHPTFRFNLYLLKKRAIKLGVLQMNDLPNVRSPHKYDVTP